jgi:S-adenosyl-L-methionine hydrolase (adenosine-forming)
VKTIALLTDFGTTDVFVGVMKTVLSIRAPRAKIIDLSHDIPPGDIAAAALRLWQAAPWLPKGTVVLAVVDPGVGTARRAVAVSLSRAAYVGPDNGIFTYLLAREPGHLAVAIQTTAPRRSTFHGRDVFAPAAALLSAGRPLRRLGPVVSDLVSLPMPAMTASPGALGGEVLLADRFGNLLTSIGILVSDGSSLALDPWIPGVPGLRLAGRTFLVRLPGGKLIPFGRTFSDVPPGSPLAYIGSDGLLEIGVNQGRAVDELGLVRGAAVSLEPVQ